MKIRFVFIFVLIISIILILPACNKKSVQKTCIDLYIIAGQSNAVGHTKISDREHYLMKCPNSKRLQKRLVYKSLKNAKQTRTRGTYCALARSYA